MSPIRLPGVAFGALALCGLFATTNCGSPTQIVLEITSDACPGSGNLPAISSTGIAVGKASEIEGRLPSWLHEGCQAPGRVGTLVLYPSGNNDDDVAIKVIGGVEAAPDRCNPPGYPGCIVHRRVLRFIPHESQTVAIRLSLACLNRQCETGQVCTDGKCTSAADLRDDGTSAAGASSTEPTKVPPPPFCPGCKGSCADGTCRVSCPGPGLPSCTGSLCEPTMPCAIDCRTPGSCRDIACTTDKTCAVTCSDRTSCAGRLTCTADQCTVSCNGVDSCAPANIALVGTSKAHLDCTGASACGAASCTSADCSLACLPALGKDSACPDPMPCTQTAPLGCAAWNPPGGSQFAAP